MVQEQKKEETVIETPTAEEQIKSMQEQVAKLTTELEQTRKGLSTAHQTLTERDKELKRRLDMETQISDLGERVELLATAIASAGVEADTETVVANKPTIISQLQQRKKEQEAERIRLSYNQRADDVYSKAKSVFANDEDALWDVEDLLKNGQLDRAERKVTKAEKTLAQAPSPSGEAKKPEIDVEIIKEEERRKVMEEQGRLVAETGSPAGGGRGEIISLRQIRETPGLYRKLFPNGESDFRKALEEGRVTE